MTSSLPSAVLAGDRDHRVDFYRGIALAMIFVNHVPGNVWENYTTRNFGFSDAAEIFVFLAGFASAFAYGKSFLAGHHLVATLKAWRRAGVLYLVHIALTMFAVAAFSWGALVFGQGGLLHNLGLAFILTRPLETIIGIVGLGHQLGYVNILPMYSVILLMLPLLLALARRGRGVMLAGSAALWVAAAIWRLDMPNYPSEGGWFFNPFAWQFLFALGLYCGLAKWQRGHGVPYHPALYGAALAYLAFAFLFVRFEAWGSEAALGLPFLVGQFDKTFVTLPRLLHVLSLIYVFAHAPKTSPLTRISEHNPFAALGRHSLPVFATGTSLSLIGQVLKFGHPPAFFADTAIVLGGLGLQFALAYYLEWWRKAQRRPRSLDAAAGARAAGTAPVAETGLQRGLHEARNGEPAWVETRIIPSSGPSGGVS